MKIKSLMELELFHQFHEVTVLLNQLVDVEALMGVETVVDHVVGQGKDQGEWEYLHLLDLLVCVFLRSNELAYPPL